MLTPVTLPCYLTINQQRTLHKLITYPVTPLPYLAFKNAFLKLIRSLGFLSIRCPRLLLWHFTINTSQQVRVSRLALLHVSQWTQVWFSNTWPQVLKKICCGCAVHSLLFLSPKQAVNLATSSWSWRAQRWYQKKSGCFGGTWVSQDFPSTFSAVEPRGGLASYFNALTEASCISYGPVIQEDELNYCAFYLIYIHTVPLPTASILHLQNSHFIF